MMKMRIRTGLAVFAIAVTAFMASGHASQADSKAEIDAKVDIALNALLAESPAAQAISDKALAVLVFPDVIKAGLGVGGLFGEGALRMGGTTTGYYNLAAASFGWQIGAQSYSQIMYFMTEEAMKSLDKVKGFEIGADVNVAVIEKGASANVTTATITDPIVAFVVGQKGLMAGATIEGSKITKINPK
jgi:lipid-binding SYLF domain-containing protein